MVDLSRVPVSALSAETKHLISTLLNPMKVIPCDSGLLRDWRGLLHISSIEAEVLPEINRHGDPFSCILSIVQKRSPDFTLQRLKDALEAIERWDIVDDAEPLLEKDAQMYLERLERSRTSAETNDFKLEEKILTLDDQCRIERGEGTQHYDAFVLYADEDLPFVNDIVEVLENQHNFKLCLKDRDLIAGITFEHKAVMGLIYERCNRLITIMSPNFLKSPANNFFLHFAQASGIDKNTERKVIPVIYETCELPPALSFFSKIYYSKFAAKFFWEKLVRSIKVNNSTASTSITMTAPKQKEPETKNAIESSNSEKSNGLVDNRHEKSVEEQENSSKQPCKSPPKATVSLRIFPWKKKQKSETNQVPNQIPSSNEESTPSESIPSLPSLEGLDSLSSITTNTKTKKKKKFMSGYMKKVQSVLAKS